MQHIALFEQISSEQSISNAFLNTPTLFESTFKSTYTVSSNSTKMDNFGYFGSVCRTDPK